MRESTAKIFGLLIFLFLLSGVLYLTFFSQKKINKGEIKMIEVTGNKLLNETDYLKLTKLNDRTAYIDLSLPVIKDRILKHPYVLKADVEYDGLGGVRIEIKEKKIKAVILNDGEPYFITEKYQILPLLPGSQFSDLPIISNLPDSVKIRTLSVLNNEEIKEAFKIIDAAKLTNESMLNHMAEINLRKGGDIILTFSRVKLPVIFGRNGAAKKMVYLDILWDDMLAQKEIVENSEYIDLRFSNEIYIGKSEKIGLN